VPTLTAPGFALFDTPIGRIGMAWTETGVRSVQLPASRDEVTRARLLHDCPAAREAKPPPEVQRALEAILALLSGEPRDLSAITLDTRTLPAFDCQVYELARAIPPGSTRSYGAIAAQLGDRLLARDVGQALARNPFPIIVPCHRVVAADGSAGGFSAPGGARTKLRLLALEGWRPTGTLPLFED
jgi:methylated-DNA-[protein]-cysteine S-methyltransferase